MRNSYWLYIVERIKFRPHDVFYIMYIEHTVLCTFCQSTEGTVELFKNGTVCA